VRTGSVIWGGEGNSASIGPKPFSGLLQLKQQIIFLKIKKFMD